MIGNSGRFSETLPVLLADNPFQNFLQISDALYTTAGSTWKISLKRLFELLFTAMTQNLNISIETSQQVLLQDYQRSGQKGFLKFDQDLSCNATRKGVANKRQKQHLS